MKITILFSFIIEERKMAYDFISQIRYLVSVYVVATHFTTDKNQW